VEGCDHDLTLCTVLRFSRKIEVQFTTVEIGDQYSNPAPTECKSKAFPLEPTISCFMLFTF
jgi:hypothetical protein